MVDDDDDGSDLLLDFHLPEPDESAVQDRHFVGSPKVSQSFSDHFGIHHTQIHECYVVEPVVLKSVVSQVKNKVCKNSDNHISYVSDDLRNSQKRWSTEKIKHHFQQLQNRRRMHHETPLSDRELSSSGECQPRCVIPSEKTITSVPHVALFASHNAVGIIDSGASQTIMGSHQEAEFVSSLPAEVRAKIYESPVQMSFRFGNNSTVNCNRALVVPIGPVWIKVAIVETRTPFLISNNVLRQLGAVIDTEDHSIYFKRLQCTVPLSLTDRKLFTMNIGDMIEIARNAKFTRLVKTAASHQPQPVFHALGNEDKFQNHEESTSNSNKDIRNSNKDVRKVPTLEGPLSSIDKIPETISNDSSAGSPDVMKSQMVDEDKLINNVADSDLKTHREACLAFVSPSTDHHVPLVGRPSREDQEGRGPSREEGGSGTDELRRAAEPCDSIRKVQGWHSIPPGDARRSELCDVVCEKLQGFQEGYPCGVSHLHRAIHRAHGSQDRSGEWICLPQQYQTSEDSRRSTRSTSKSNLSRGLSQGALQNDRRGGRFRVGCSDLGDGGSCRECVDPKSPDSNGKCDAAHDADSPTDSAATTSAAKGVNDDSRSSAVHLTCLSESVFEIRSPKSNWVAQEMWEYFEKRDF